MKDIDFSTCRLIDELLCFLTYHDFCNNRFRFKKSYENLSDDGKLFYKWYVYSNIHMDEYFKNLIWEYLNGDDLYGAELMKARRKYKVK